MRAQPEDDLFFLLVDVTTPEGLDHWMRDLQDGRNITVFAEEGGKLLGYSSLHHGQTRWTRRLGEIRLPMAPRQRGRGVGRFAWPGDLFDHPRSWICRGWRPASPASAACSNVPAFIRKPCVPIG